ncbi:thioredoxin family protein [Mucilaginibacter paludis]|uniref:Thioredoxin domain-containing protein n=1 Tax=Mucilaginibacter paludis DSM 18603 TaxID=714943 RepID=H1YE83_9SPHI|nr:thioredoxin family protein [Mucilaginibacter paludis]EHQ26146.1 thioredoxin domain-containing protein [Mucilaginibacter paludis DSM 18603]
MRRSLTFLMLLLGLATTVQGQDKPGIRFFSGNWKAMLAAAQARHLPVFVDVYTDWCAPCKRMEKEVFVLPEVDSFFNENFLCYRLNAEKGEGPGIAKAYGIRAYPTWLYLSADGSLRSRQTDYMAPADFIASAKVALGKGAVADSLAVLSARFKNGDRDSAFLHRYLEKRTGLHLDNAEILDAYILVLRNKDQISAEQLRFLVANSGNTWSAAVPLIVGQLDQLDTAGQRSVATDLYSRLVYNVWGYAAKTGDKPQAEQAMAVAERLHPLLGEQQQASFDNVALFHCRKFRDLTGLKKVGYRLAGKQMAIDTAFARHQDKVMYEKVKSFYTNEPADPVKKQDFNEEKKLAMGQYSGQAAATLYNVAEAFAEVLPPNDPGRKDAHGWAERAFLLVPNLRTRELAERLKR